jgi:hypothetical protein
MTNPVFLGAGKVFPKAGVITGQNRAGQQISGHRVEPGHWQLSNQKNGAQLDVQMDFVGKNKHVGHAQITRTDAQGNQTQNDVTILRGQGRQIGIYDLNQSGFQAIG